MWGVVVVVVGGGEGAVALCRAPNIHSLISRCGSRLQRTCGTIFRKLGARRRLHTVEGKDSCRPVESLFTFVLGLIIYCTPG